MGSRKVICWGRNASGKVTGKKVVELPLDGFPIGDRGTVHLTGLERTRESSMVVAVDSNRHCSGDAVCWLNVASAGLIFLN